MTRPAAPLLLLACLVSGCQERASSVSEGEPAADAAALDTAADGATPDAGPTPDPEPSPEPDPEPAPEPEPEPTPDPDPGPACGYTPEPLTDCTAPAEPAADCTARIDGDRRFVATFADGRQTSLLDGDGSGFVATFDDQPSSRIDTVEAGCVQRRRDEERVGERTLEARVNRGGASCLLETWRDGDLLEQLEDAGCDCRDLVVRQRCAYGPQGPLSCVWRTRDGALSTRRSWVYGADGETHEAQRYLDGEVFSIERRTIDAEGRLAEVVILSVEPGRAPVVERRVTITYTQDPRQTTERQDAGDDGWAEIVRRTTWDDGRIVRFEEGDDDGFTTVVETAYRDDGYDRTTTVDGEVTRTERQVRAADGVVTTTVITAERTETETVTGDAEGRLVERVIERVPGGTFTERLTWDEQGRLLSEHITFTGAPAFECALAYAWVGDCPGPAGRFNDACAFELPP